MTNLSIDIKPAMTYIIYSPFLVSCVVPSRASEYIGGIVLFYARISNS